MAELNAKQEAFVAEYLVDFNATQAAIRAGYSESTARQQGSRLLSHADVQEAVAERYKAHLSEVDLTAQDVLRELHRLATSDLRKIVDEHGNLLPLHDWPDEVAAAVAGVEVVTTYPNGKDEPPEYIKKVRLWDKNTALTNLAKHFGLLKDLVEWTGKDGGPIITKIERVIVEGSDAANAKD